MEQFVKPIVGISKCLEFENCRYDGAVVKNHLIRTMKDHVEFLPVCPEVGIGLGTPRDTIRLVKIDGKKNLYQNSNQRNLTELMNEFSDKFLDKISSIDGFILKNGSPTCGVENTRYYHKIGKEVGYDMSTGIFTDSIIKKFPNLILEDESRLRNSILRDSFLTRLFSMAHLRHSLISKSKSSIDDFFLKNQMLFMCYSPLKTKNLVYLISNRENFEKKEFNAMLKLSVFNILNRIPESESLENTFMYIFNLIKEQLQSSEINYYHALVDDYRNGFATHSQISTLLYSWALRFNLDDLKFQSIFNPYPKQLISNVVGKNRKHSLLKI